MLSPLPRCFTELVSEELAEFGAFVFQFGQLLLFDFS